MKHLKITSVLMSVVMCASMVMTPVSVIADETEAPSESQKTEEAEIEEPVTTEKQAPKETEKQEIKPSEEKETEPEETDTQVPEESGKENEAPEKPESKETQTKQPEIKEKQSPSETIKKTPKTATVDGDYGDLKWSYDDSTKTLTISGSGDMPGEDVAIPWKGFRDDIEKVVICKGVTSISKNAFFKCISLNSVSIPSGVTVISRQAFAGCTNLTSISIPSTVTKIDMNVFEGCHKLENVKLNKGLKTIGYVYTRN